MPDLSRRGSLRSPANNGGPEPVKTLMIGRIDYPPKAGGDAVQMMAYKRILEAMGISVEIASEVQAHAVYDVVHLFNIDRPFDLLAQTRRISNRPLMILHAIHENDEYYLHPRPTDFFLKAFIRRLRFMSLKYFVRLLTSKRLALDLLISPLLTRQQAVHRIASRVDFFHFLSLRELDWFVHDYGLEISPEKVLIFGNGAWVSEPEPSKASGIRDIDVLVPGRIEPLKNSVQIAKILTEFPDRKVVFCGQLNKNHPRFGRQFLRVVHSSSNIEYLGELNYEDMLALYRRAKLVVSQSLREVAPLVEVEGLANQCAVISTSRSASDLAIPRETGYSRCNPFDPKEFIVELTHVFRRLDAGWQPHYDLDLSWQSVCQPMVRLYESLLERFHQAKLQKSR
jgi:glycosyltransferase involved in cell wall biosynthesis